MYGLITQLKISYSLHWVNKFCKILILNRWNERILLLTVVNIRFELYYYFFLFLMSGWVVHTGTMQVYSLQSHFKLMKRVHSTCILFQPVLQGLDFHDRFHVSLFVFSLKGAEVDSCPRLFLSKYYKRGWFSYFLFVFIGFRSS